MRISDWSSDVCSSDLDLVTVALAVDVGHFGDVGAAITAAAAFDGAHALADRAAAVAIAVVIIAITIARIVVTAAVTVVVAVVTVVIAARQNRGEAAEDDGAGDAFARADPVAVMAVARGGGGGRERTPLD